MSVIIWLVVVAFSVAALFIMVIQALFDILLYIKSIIVKYLVWRPYIRIISQDIDAPHITNQKSTLDHIRKTFQKDMEIKHSGRNDQRDCWEYWRQAFNKGRHWNISANVYHRLMLRHAIIRDTVSLERQLNPACKASHERNQCDCNPVASTHECSTKSKADTEVGKQENAEKELCPHLQSYHIATTDLFVEKAIAYLEHDYENYMKVGNKRILLGYIITIVGIITSLLFMIDKDLCDGASSLATCPRFTYEEILSKTLKGISFYAMLVTLAVALWRSGKANLQQAERLRERRHALRQGRLFVHLKDGALTIDELDKAFNWNAHKENGFDTMSAEANAPLSGLFQKLQGIFR